MLANRIVVGGQNARLAKRFHRVVVFALAGLDLPHLVAKRGAVLEAVGLGLEVIQAQSSERFMATSISADASV